MGFDFNNSTPIYLQIIECIKKQIIIGVYKPNDKIPSVRELSLQFSVNPNTIQKALVELERIGLIYTERTNGKFVTHDQQVIDIVRRETLNSLISMFCDSMQEFGLSKREIIDMLENKE